MGYCVCPWLKGSLRAASVLHKIPSQNPTACIETEVQITGVVLIMVLCVGQALRMPMSGTLCLWGTFRSHMLQEIF